jgi:hypothetical protein
MVGSGREGRGPAEVLRALLRMTDDRPAALDGLPRAVGRELEPWALLVSGRTEAGYAAWRTALARGLEAGPAGRGTWDPADTEPAVGAPATAILLGTLAHGLLGLSPDAPSGRIGIAPAFPAHFTSFAASGIRVGDVRISLRYDRVGNLHRFELNPVAGAVPAMAIFEPSIPGRRLDGVRVDGSAADLDMLLEEERTRLRVQLPLDSTRVVEVKG